MAASGDGRWGGLRRRAVALVAESRCRALAGRPLDALWLASAAAWLAEAAGPWGELVGGVPAARAYRSVDASPDLECWLIAWPPGGRLHLHDHGGASGAVHVVAGVLHESGAVAGPPGPDGRRPLSQPLRTRIVRAGDSLSFGPAYVHDVVGAPGAVATSVHVYSAPVGPMRFWAASRGMLLPDAPAAPEAPEVPAPAGPGPAAADHGTASVGPPER